MRKLYSYVCLICHQLLEADFLIDIVQLYQDHNCSDSQFGVMCNHCNVGTKSNKEFIIHYIETHSCSYIERIFRQREDAIAEKEEDNEIAKDCRAGIL